MKPLSRFKSLSLVALAATVCIIGTAASLTVTQRTGAGARRIQDGDIGRNPLGGQRPAHRIGHHLDAPQIPQRGPGCARRSA